MSSRLPNPSEAYEAAGFIALLSVVCVWCMGAVFGLLFMVVVLAATAHIGNQED